MSRSKDKRIWTIQTAAALILSLPVFFYDMIFEGRGFFYGDYRAQYYPWALELARSLKRLTLPFWSSDIGCGFPLLAEGQAGALQPVKWILYGLMPIKWGYPIGFLFAFLAAGWFTASFLRRLRQPCSSGVLAAWVYCYGSAYAGLAWGNASLWVMAWLPWAFDRAEALCSKPQKKNVCKLALVCALLWLGGFPQMALYGSAFVGIYIIVRRPAATLWGLTALTAGLLAASAQMLPTLELAAMSARSQTGLEFALQKSFHPFNLSTLVMPSLGFWGADFYIGILPLVLAVFAVWRLRKEAAARAVAAVALGAIVVALGKWNPLYVALVRALELYSFRASSKCLMIAAFGLALLAGLGWGAWLKEGAGRVKVLIAATVLGSAAAVWAVAFGAARWAAPAIQGWAEAYVRSDVYGRAGHPHSLENYLDRIPVFLGILVERTSPINYYVVCTFAVSLGVLVWLWAQRPQTPRLVRAWVPALGLCLVFADLFGFSLVGSGFRGNRVPASTLDPNAAIGYVDRIKGEFRVYEFIQDPMDPPRWIPNSNLIAGYPSIGVYTPLSLSAYSEQVRALGAVDDSTGIRTASRLAPLEQIDLLSRLNTRFLMSRGPLTEAGSWNRVNESADGTVLYENVSFWPRAYWADAAEGSTAGVGVSVKGNRPGFYRIKTDSDEARSLVISENAVGTGSPWSSGWHARLDDKNVAVQVYKNTFLSLQVPSGVHEIVLAYRPTRFWMGLAISVVSVLLLLSGCRSGRSRR